MAFVDAEELGEFAVLRARESDADALVQCPCVSVTSGW